LTCCRRGALGGCSSLGELGTLMHKRSSCQEGGCGSLGDMGMLGMSMQKRSQELF
jgi:hypothetical protein